MGGFEGLMTRGAQGGRGRGDGDGEVGGEGKKGAGRKGSLIVYEVCERALLVNGKDRVKAKWASHE